MILSLLLSCFAFVSKTVFLMALLIAILDAIGCKNRLVRFLLEAEALKALNGTAVTVGQVQVDWVRGTVWATDVIVHAPQRATWHWESPILARFGKVRVQANVVWALFSLWFLWEEPSLDIISVEMEDVQGFIERKLNLFNFFLLDPHVKLPDDSVLAQLDQVASDESLDDSDGVKSRNRSSSDPAEVKAQQLMDSVLGALHQAAQEGSIHGAFLKHRQNLTDHLKFFQSSKKSEVMQEGLEIAKHVSKSVVTKSQTAQQVVQPSRLDPTSDEKIVYARIGRVVLRDCLIYTRDHQKQQSQSDIRSWNQPIKITRVDVRSSELCPSLSSKDASGYPSVYQPVDCFLEVIFRRLLSEGAKSSTSRLFQSAMGELLGYWMEKESSGLQGIDN